MVAKHKIAQSFSRSAHSYDRVAHLQREVCDHLYDLLLQQPQGFQRIVDLGCGTGYLQPRLQERFPQAQLIGLDIAEGMLNFIRQRQAQSSVDLLCADIEALPLVDQSADLLFSNLAVQWSENLPKLFGEASRVLKAGGLFCFSTLGTDTLFELRESWREVDSHTHVNQFQPHKNWQAAITEAGFEVLQEERKHQSIYCADLKQLAMELKLLGAHNMNEGQQQSLTTPSRWKKLSEAYEKFRKKEKGLPATYEVYYWVLKRHS